MPQWQRWGRVPERCIQRAIEHYMEEPEIIQHPTQTLAVIAPTPTLPRASPRGWRCGQAGRGGQVPGKCKFCGMCGWSRVGGNAAGSGGGNAPDVPAAPAAATPLATITPLTPLMPSTPQELLAPLGATVLGTMDPPAGEDEAGGQGQSSKKKHRSRGTDEQTIARRRQNRHPYIVIERMEAKLQNITMYPKHRPRQLARLGLAEKCEISTWKRRRLAGTPLATLPRPRRRSLQRRQALLPRPCRSR